jgi:sugar phosphate isomerase/epimerase
VHPVEDLVPAAAAAGFAGVGLDWFSLRDAERRGRTVGELAALAADQGVRWTDLSALGLGADPDRDAGVAASMLRRCTALAIGVCGLVVSVPVDGAVRDRIARCADTFAAAGVRLALEPVPYTAVRTLDEARALVRDVGPARIGLLVDLLHLVRGGGSPADVEDLDPREIAAVQISDAPAGAPADLPTESREGRLLPGDGELGVGTFAEALARTGWSGVVSTEVLSAELRALPAPRLAAECAAAARRFFPDPD